jgi:hypothetical protein
MVRGTITRLVTTITAVAVALALASGAASAAAVAAPKAAPKPDAVQLAGTGIEETILVKQEERPKLFQMLLSEVNWLAQASASTSAVPTASKLGPKFTVTLLVKNAPNQVYHLYPLAQGGPRAHRPAKQPVGKKTEAWFYGRLSMPESLRLGGAPLEGKPDIVQSGIGGGVGTDLAAKEVNPVEEVTQAFTEFRRLFLLNGAVLLVILTGLAGMAFLIRRRI